MSTSQRRNRRPTVRPLTAILSVLGAIAMVAAVVVGLNLRNHRDGASVQTAESPAETTTSAEAPAPANCSLSLRDKLAQLLMVGVKDAADARAVVADHKVGGIFIGSWTDLGMLGDPLREIEAVAVDTEAKIPLAVSVDEEGGRVSRLKKVIGEQLAPRELVAAGKTAEQVEELAEQRAKEMVKLGITIDFAPLLDVTSGDPDGAIGDRSFSGDPAVVTKYAGAYARGLKKGGLTAVFKHFPGHGHASGDSHTGGVSTPPLAQLENNDLLPYKDLIPQHLAEVMVGHMVVPGLTDGKQASLSGPAYTKLREMGFTDVAFTDDLSSMKAITDIYPVPDAVLLSLQAGADIALWVTTDEVPAVLDRLEKAVADNELPMERVNEALGRVLKMKGAPPLGC